MSSDGIMSKMGDSIESILSIPDSFESPAGRKAARIFADFLVIGLGFLVLRIVTGGNFASLAAPSMSMMMGLPAAVLISSVGLAWLFEDILSKEVHRTASKIMAFVMPLALAASAGCLIAAAFHSGISPICMSNYWFAGILLVPLAFFYLPFGSLKGGSQDAQFCRRSDQKVDQSDKGRRGRLQDQRRVQNSENHRLDEAERSEIELDDLSEDGPRIISLDSSEEDDNRPMPVVESLSTSSSSTEEMH